MGKMFTTDAQNTQKKFLQICPFLQLRFFVPYEPLWFRNIKKLLSMCLKFISH